MPPNGWRQAWIATGSSGLCKKDRRELTPLFNGSTRPINSKSTSLIKKQQVYESYQKDNLLANIGEQVARLLGNKP